MTKIGNEQMYCWRHSHQPESLVKGTVSRLIITSALIWAVTRSVVDHVRWSLNGGCRRKPCGTACVYRPSTEKWMAACLSVCHSSWLDTSSLHQHLRFYETLIEFEVCSEWWVWEFSWPFWLSWSPVWLASLWWKAAQEQRLWMLRQRHPLHRRMRWGIFRETML